MLMDHSPFRVAIGPSSRSRIAPDVVPIRPAGPRCGRGVIVAGGSPVNPEEIAQRLELLRIEHRDLDAAIIALAAATVPDQLLLAAIGSWRALVRTQIGRAHV